MEAILRVSVVQPALGLVDVLLKSSRSFGLNQPFSSFALAAAMSSVSCRFLLRISVSNLSLILRRTCASVQPQSIDAGIAKSRMSTAASARSSLDIPDCLCCFQLLHGNVSSLFRQAQAFLEVVDNPYA